MDVALLVCAPIKEKRIRHFLLFVFCLDKIAHCEKKEESSGDGRSWLNPYTVSIERHSASAPTSAVLSPLAVHDDPYRCDIKKTWTASFVYIYISKMARPRIADDDITLFPLFNVFFLFFFYYVAPQFGLLPDCGYRFAARLPVDGKTNRRRRRVLRVITSTIVSSSQWRRRRQVISRLPYRRRCRLDGRHIGHKNVDTQRRLGWSTDSIRVS